VLDDGPKAGIAKFYIRRCLFWRVGSKVTIQYGQFEVGVSIRFAKSY
jgi:hypothetical protein